MAWVQNTSPPANRRAEMALKDFSGGLNNKSQIISSHEASDLRNMKFLYSDVMEKRNGIKKFDELVLNSAITFMHEYRPYTGDDEIIRATSTEVYAGHKKIADVQGNIQGINFQGMFIFCDGQDMFAYADHTSTTSTYLEVIGSKPEGRTALKVVNPTEGYTPLEEIHQQGKLVYNYDDLTVHYEPCINELDDVYLGANLLPEHPTFIVTHNSRVYVSGDKNDDDNVYMTDINVPFYFAVALPIQLPPNSDKVRGLVVWDDAVVVGREFDMYRIIGETANPELGFSLFELRKINVHSGFANYKAFDTGHSYLFFVGADGTMYALGTTRMDERLLSTQIISQTLDIYKAPISVTRDDLRDVSSVFDENAWYVNIGDKTLVYSYQHRTWTMYDYVDMYSPLFFQDKLVWGRHDGIVAEFSDDYTDFGRPIYAYWQSKAFDMEQPSRYKQFREFYLVAYAYDNIDTEVRLTFQLDYANVYNDTDIENKLSLWGKSKFGDRFVDRNVKSSLPTMLGRRARIIRLRFENGYDLLGTVPLVNDLLDTPDKWNYVCWFVEETQSYHYYHNGRWYELSDDEVNQPMMVYEINGEYEMKGKR